MHPPPHKPTITFGNLSEFTINHEARIILVLYKPGKFWDTARSQPESLHVLLLSLALLKKQWEQKL
jgi:hypothetical protein